MSFSYRVIQGKTETKTEIIMGQINSEDNEKGLMIEWRWHYRSKCGCKIMCLVDPARER